MEAEQKWWTASHHLLGCILLSPSASISAIVSCFYLDIKGFIFGIVFQCFIARPRFLRRKGKQPLEACTCDTHSFI